MILLSQRWICAFSKLSHGKMTGIKFFRIFGNMRTRNLFTYTIIFLIGCSGSADENNLSNVFDSISDSLNKRDTMGSVIKIGKQVWMKKNLNVDVFRNGDRIPQAKTPQEWKLAGDNKQPVWCYYNFDSENGGKYGKLYNWYAVTDSRGLAPEGFHVPNSLETVELDVFVSNYIEYDKKKCHKYTLPINHIKNGCPTGEKLKASKGWNPIEGFDNNGLDAVGFSAVPGGRVGSVYPGAFDDPPPPACAFNYEGEHAFWWTSTEKSEYNALSFEIVSDVFRSSSETAMWCDKTSGLSVRCIANE